MGEGGELLRFNPQRTGQLSQKSRGGGRVPRGMRPFLVDELIFTEIPGFWDLPVPNGGFHIAERLFVQKLREEFLREPQQGNPLMWGNCFRRGESMSHRRGQQKPLIGSIGLSILTCGGVVLVTWLAMTPGVKARLGITPAVTAKQSVIRGNLAAPAADLFDEENESAGVTRDNDLIGGRTLPFNWPTIPVILSMMRQMNRRTPPT